MADLPDNSQPQPQPVPVTSSAPATPPAIPRKDTPFRHFLNLVFLGVIVVAITVDIYVVYLVGSLINFAYSGSHDPTSVNGLGFPVAMVTLVIYGAPAAAVTIAGFFGYQMTKPVKPTPTL